MKHAKFSYDRGWLTECNNIEYPPTGPVPALFNTVNLFTGQSLSLEYSENDKGFILYLIQCCRQNGVWKLPEHKPDTLEFISLDEALARVQAELNPEKQSPVPLALYNGWCISRNRLPPAPVEGHLFFASCRKKYFTDISFIGGKYRVTTGQGSIASPLAVTAEEAHDVTDTECGTLDEALVLFNKYMDESD
ncbi:hypothetical protein [Breznakiella homolactica]|uniref:Uncharacterized protein n=1 Tax=Breznakiella homolactica TaxID=2798577 RepID=A0A7T8B7T0_9SPIR|nr:hypothetical protein [Breznakiella homolactica]QQO07849.1 hypothetical protein JFL75_12965 [Breznakiella homolactica]